MKRHVIIALLLVALLCVGAVLPASAEKLSGGWEANAKAASYLTRTETKIFNKAVKGLTGVEYAPVLTLAKQVVAGTNYAFLCKSTTVTADPVQSWKVLIVNRSAKGKVKLLKINKFNFKSLKTRKTPYKYSFAPGAWEYSGEGTASKGIPTAAKKAFKKAAKGLVGVSYTPLALLGTQVVAGTNYKFLCRGDIMDGLTTSCLYEVIVYSDVQGKCEITSSAVLNLPAYLKY